MVAALLLLAVGCETTEVKRDTGYKGRARIDPWLAAERFLQRKGYTVRSLGSWKNPEWNDAVCFLPAAILTNEGFVRKMKRWVEDGGHLVLLVDDAESDRNDWPERSAPLVRLEKPLVAFLKGASLELELHGGKPADEITFQKTPFKVAANSGTAVKRNGGKPRVFASRVFGGGRISVVTDAKLFRSRWIGDAEHAALLAALVEGSPNEGTVLFVRGSGVSLWGLLARYLWPVLIGLAVLLAVWLWKSFSRFGPLEAVATASPLRGYDHHLEALGDFQWRLDRGAALLGPLREQIVEGGQKLAGKSGRRDEDFFQLLADRAGLPRERVFQALADGPPTDSLVMTRTAADLQRLLVALR
jgi:hypothetical protein